MHIENFKVFNVLGIICAEASNSSGRGFYGLILTSGLWITGCLLLFHISGGSKFETESAVITFEVGFSSICILLYIIPMFWMIIFGSGAAAFFAFAAILAYGYYSWFKISLFVEKPSNNDDESD